MKTSALLLAVVVALSAAPVRADEVTEPAPKHRGFATGLGLVLLAVGMGGISLGLGGLLGANDAAYRMSLYGTPTATEADGYAVLKARLESSTTHEAERGERGALAIAGGITCVLLDAPTPSVAFVPTAQGGMLVFSGRF